MAGGRIYHWKHGWIPLDRAARLSKAHKGAPPSKIDAAVRGSIRSKNYPGAKPSPAKAPPKAPSRSAGPSNADKIKNAEKMYGTGSKQHREAQRRFGETRQMGPREQARADAAQAREAKVSWAAGSFKATPAQRREVTKAIMDFQAEFPGMPGKVRVKTITASNMRAEGGDEAWAVTSTRHAEGYIIQINETLFDDQGLMEKLPRMKDGDAMIASGVATNAAQFRRIAIQHEMAHFMHMQNQWAVAKGREDVFTNDDDRQNFIDALADDGMGGAINRLANSGVTPREMGWASLGGGLPESVMDEKIARWKVDGLDHQSAYAYGQNQYEWWAEALMDGWLNGAKASDGGKKAFALAQKLYGKAKS